MENVEIFVSKYLFFKKKGVRKSFIFKFILRWGRKAFGGAENLRLRRASNIVHLIHLHFALTNENNDCFPQLMICIHDPLNELERQRRRSLASSSISWLKQINNCSEIYIYIFIELENMMIKLD